MIFSDAIRTAEHSPRKLSGASLQVEEFEDENADDFEEIVMDSTRIMVSGLPDRTTKTQLVIYFQSERDSGGGDVQSIEIDGERAFVTFEEAKGTFLTFVSYSFSLIYRY